MAKKEKKQHPILEDILNCSFKAYLSFKERLNFYKKRKSNDHNKLTNKNHLRFTKIKREITLFFCSLFNSLLPLYF